MIFPTPFDLGKNYSSINCEALNTGPLLVDSSCYESIDSLVSRLMRGEAVTGHSGVYYDIPDNVQSADEAIASIDPSRTDGFDLADTPGILANAADARQKLMNAEKKRFADITAANQNIKEVSK